MDPRLFLFGLKAISYVRNGSFRASRKTSVRLLLPGDEEAASTDRLEAKDHLPLSVFFTKEPIARRASFLYRFLPGASRRQGLNLRHQRSSAKLYGCIVGSAIITLDGRNFSSYAACEIFGRLEGLGGQRLPCVCPLYIEA